MNKHLFIEYCALSAARLNAKYINYIFLVCICGSICQWIFQMRFCRFFHSYYWLSRWIVKLTDNLIKISKWKRHRHRRENEIFIKSWHILPSEIRINFTIELSNEPKLFPVIRTRFLSFNIIYLFIFFLLRSLLLLFLSYLYWILWIDIISKFFLASQSHCNSHEPLELTFLLWPKLQ